MSRALSKKSLLGNVNPHACYPERLEQEDHAGVRLWSFLTWYGLHRWNSGSRSLARIVGPVEQIGARLETLASGALRAEVEELRGQLRRHGLRQDLIAWSFALIRETASRTLGVKHYPVQLMGGLALLRGNLAEMSTGEGKTLTATLPACTAALAGVPVHVITVNDYLVQRDAELMCPVYEALGITVGFVIQGMEPRLRAQAYQCDVTYCNNKELVFDYLKDRIVIGALSSPAHLQMERLYRTAPRSDRLVHRGLYFAIVDEADSVMVDEASTPLIIAGQKSSRYADRTYHEAVELARSLTEPGEYTLERGEGRITLTSVGKESLEIKTQCMEQFWRIRPNREELVTLALRALHCFAKDRHYLIDDGKIQIIDEFTGRVMPDRNWEGGLHQMIEAKEGCEVTGIQETIARITYQRFFRRYLHLAGMTGTAKEVAGEMWRVYRLKTVRIPTNRPSRRTELRGEITGTSARKWGAIVTHVDTLHRDQGRPILIGTRSVEASEHLSRLLTEASLTHTVLNARQDKQEAEIVKLAGGQGRITIATNMAGRGTDIHLGPGVAELGGLHVVLTEHHEARRIDRQLYGRAARQGDPGSCVAITSLEDELVANFRLKAPPLLATFLPSTESFPLRIRRLLVYLSQVNAELRNVAIRRETLRADKKLDQLLSFTGRVE